MRKLFILSGFIFIIVSCKSKQTTQQKQQELGTGKLTEKNVYTANEVGWTIQLPDWDVITKKENARLAEKGKEMVEKSIGQEVNTSGLVELINLKKDAFNNFLSTIEAFNESSDGSYAEHNKLVNQVLKKTYASKKIYAEYIEDSVLIDGVKFDVFSTKVYNPGKTKVIISQKMFSALINGYDFAMTMTYNNDADMKILEAAIYSSKFSKRN